MSNFLRDWLTSGHPMRPLRKEPVRADILSEMLSTHLGQADGVSYWWTHLRSLFLSFRGSFLEVLEKSYSRRWSVALSSKADFCKLMGGNKEKSSRGGYFLRSWNLLIIIKWKASLHILRSLPPGTGQLVSKIASAWHWWKLRTF